MICFDMYDLLIMIIIIIIKFNYNTYLFAETYRWNILSQKVFCL